MRPTDPSSRPDAPPRDVVWAVGEEPGRARRLHPLRRWLTLLLLVGALSFALAYAVHVVVSAPAPSGPGVPLWWPERLPADGCAASRTVRGA